MLSQQDPRGTFTFTGAAAGSDFAGFLFGVPDTASIAFGNADKYFRANSWDAYVSDDWRFRSGFSLTLGVRYEYNSPITELYGRLVNLAVANHFASAAPVVARSAGPLIQPDRNNLAPRIGFAWRPFAGVHHDRARRLRNLLRQPALSVHRHADGPAGAALHQPARAEQRGQSADAGRTASAVRPTSSTPPSRSIRISAPATRRTGSFRAARSAASRCRWSRPIWASKARAACSSSCRTRFPPAR